MPFAELAMQISMHPWLTGAVCVSGLIAWMTKDSPLPMAGDLYLTVFVCISVFAIRTFLGAGA